MLRNPIMDIFSLAQLFMTKNTHYTRFERLWESLYIEKWSFFRHLQLPASASTPEVLQAISTSTLFQLQLSAVTSSSLSEDSQVINLYKPWEAQFTTLFSRTLDVDAYQQKNRHLLLFGRCGDFCGGWGFEYRIFPRPRQNRMEGLRSG